MTTVITLHAAEQGAAMAAAIAARLPGPSVVLPFAALHGEWIAEPLGGERDAAIASQQLKLLTAGYVKAGYHVVVHGEALHETGAGDDLLRLIRMVPGVRALSVGVGDDAADIDLALPAGATVESVAAAVAAALTERPAPDA
ncbi:MAG: hypothetical protein OXG38_10320 [Chloroflexi bacterium]|nr:hypothetical protein [Chloroflexota bacterium]